MAPPDIMAKVARRQHDALILLRQTHGIVCTVIVGVCIALAWFDVVPGLDTFVFLPRAVPGGTGPSWASTLYEHHPDDMYFIGFWAIGLTALRVIVMRGPLEVIASLMGCPKGNLHKFKEMGWLVSYYVTAWCACLYISFFSEEAFVSVYREEGGWMYWVDHSKWWAGYPNHPLYGRMKVYYLLQLSFWIHMVFVTLVEEWRKDFLMMMVHHAVTIFLISASYFSHFERSGSFVLLVLDLADCLLPLAKIMRYCGHRLAADIVFALFTLVWIVTRHFLYWIPVYSLTVHAPNEITVDFDPSIGSYYSRKWTHVFYLTLFIILQVLLLFWLKLLIVAVHKALTAGHIDDHRSDSEGEEDTEPRAARKRKPAASSDKNEEEETNTVSPKYSAGSSGALRRRRHD